MNKILVGFDGSEGSKKALDKSISLINENGELILLAVIPSPSEKSFVDVETYKSLKKRAKDIIDEIINDIGKQEYTIKGIIEEGDPSVQIINTSTKLNVDLIVLGSRGTSKIGRYLIGSVANKVVQYAYKPVMVVR